MQQNLLGISEHLLCFQVQLTLIAGGLILSKAWQTFKQYDAGFFGKLQAPATFHACCSATVAVIGALSSMQRQGVGGQLLEAVSHYILNDSAYSTLRHPHNVISLSICYYSIQLPSWMTGLL